MEREKLNMEDVFEQLQELDCDSLDENNILYKFVEEKQVDYDSEKGFVDYEIIFKRLKDDSYFKVSYTKFGHDGDNMDEQFAYQVFPQTKTIITYK